MLPDGEIQQFQVHYLCKNQAIHISWHLLCRSLGVQSVSEKSDSSVIPLSSVGGVGRGCQPARSWQIWSPIVFQRTISVRHKGKTCV